jgi:hypothetical protein
MIKRMLFKWNWFLGLFVRLLFFEPPVRFARETLSCNVDMKRVFQTLLRVETVEIFSN